jgi:hypothetical protein
MITSAHNNMMRENMEYYTYIDLLSNINILHFENWPEGDDIRCGNKSVRKFREKFSLVKKYLSCGFREYKMDRENVYDDLKPLFIAISMVSTSDRQHNFYALNNIITAKQNSCNILTIASLLFIKLVEPPTNQYNVTKYVE